MAILSVNPASGKELARYEPLTGPQVGERLTAAAHAFRSWRETPIGERAEPMRELAELLDSDQ